MSTSTAIRLESRALNEAYGPGAWHGADLRAALADVAPTSRLEWQHQPLAAAERFNLVLGITCHAIYHAGQIQPIKRLREE
jgi:hypothetical protein